MFSPPKRRSKGTSAHIPSDTCNHYLVLSSAASSVHSYWTSFNKGGLCYVLSYYRHRQARCLPFRLWPSEQLQRALIVLLGRSWQSSIYPGLGKRKRFTAPTPTHISRCSPRCCKPNFYRSAFKIPEVDSSTGRTTGWNGISFAEFARDVDLAAHLRDTILRIKDGIQPRETSMKYNAIIGCTVAQVSPLTLIG